MECTVCTVTYPDTCTFICAYRYHRTPHADFLADLNQVIHDIKAKKLVVAGDMNLNMRNETVKHNIKTKILSPNKLTQIETGPTTKTGSNYRSHIYKCGWNYSKCHSGILLRPRPYCNERYIRSYWTRTLPMIIENNENDYESSHNRVNNKSEIAQRPLFRTWKPHINKQGTIFEIVTGMYL